GPFLLLRHLAITRSNTMAHALLIIDMQAGLFDGPEKPYARERLLDTINQLIQRARSANATTNGWPGFPANGKSSRIGVAD
ncbi:isochorismatase family protein, partial [Klebsiella pneumoniae]